MTTALAQTTPLSADRSRGGVDPDARTKLSGDLDTFLRLLTAQIRNQDPLQPADGTAYAAQLAQFSTVEQAVRTNELLTRLGGALGGSGADAAAWVGLELRHDGAVPVDGTSRRLIFARPPGAERAEVVAYDAAGVERLRSTLPPGVDSIEWAGEDGAGGRLSHGLYRLEVVGWIGGEALAPVPVETYARVSEVLLGADGPTLVLDGGARIAPDRAAAIRAPAAR